jgi:hypothetical protein
MDEAVFIGFAEALFLTEIRSECQRAHVGAGLPAMASLNRHRQQAGSYKGCVCSKAAIFP